MATMPAASVDLAIFSPPFPSLFAYTSEMADIGNSENLETEARIHLGFFFRQLVRVIKPGRVAVVHVAQIPSLRRNNDAAAGGIFDFRGLCIRLARKAGFIFDFDWLVPKNPQAQAIRTHSHRLLFVTLERDRAVTTGALCDYLIKLRVPGDNAAPIISPEISRDEWIAWAEGHWSEIRETYTLNTKGTKGENDTRHICPLQLDVIDRLVRLYTNPDEIVFSPFAGIGSEGYQALRRGRRFYGIELKAEYHAAALVNLAKAIAENTEDKQQSLFESQDVERGPSPLAAASCWSDETAEQATEGRPQDLQGQK